VSGDWLHAGYVLSCVTADWQVVALLSSSPHLSFPQATQST